MTKRLLILAACLCLALLTNLSFRVPTAAQAQAGCLTGVAPAFTFGVDKNVPLPGGGVLKDGDLFYLQQGVDFTTQSPGASFFTISEASPANFGSYPGYPGTTSLGFAATTPNASATAISCLDSFWDVNFELAGTGATAGDVISLYFQQPDGTQRRDIIQLTVRGDNMSAQITGLLAGADLSAVGHTPTVVGTILPYEEAAGSAGKRTRLISIAFPMDGSVRDCNQLVVEVKRAGGTGTTTVALINLVVTRTTTSTATGKGFLGGTTGTYPTGLKCAKVCPACFTCDTSICFVDACTWYNRLCGTIYRRDFSVNIPGVNAGLPVQVYQNLQGRNCFGPACDLNPQVEIALNCAGYARKDINSQVTAAYVAAQLSIQHGLPFWYVRIDKQKLGCHIRTPMAMPGMPAPAPAIPVTLSNGVVLTGSSSLWDLFAATEWALSKGTVNDKNALLAVYSQLDNCRKD